MGARRPPTPSGTSEAAPGQSRAPSIALSLREREQFLVESAVGAADERVRPDPPRTPVDVRHAASRLGDWQTPGARPSTCRPRSRWCGSRRWWHKLAADTSPPRSSPTTENPSASVRSARTAFSTATSAPVTRSRPSLAVTRCDPTPPRAMAIARFTASTRRASPNRAQQARSQKTNRATTRRANGQHGDRSTFTSG
jgi:hypothetical protein